MGNQIERQDDIMTEWKDRKICPIMSRPVIGNPNTYGKIITQFIDRMKHNGRDYDVSLCEIKCYEDKCMFYEAGSKSIPAKCKLVINPPRGNDV